MKIVITGTANGIGKALSEKFKSCQWDVAEYDILNGNDITVPSVIHNLIQDCQDADVFINNVLPNQTVLLEKVYNLWYGIPKTIVNISSAITYLYDLDNYDEQFKNYYECKYYLNKKTLELQIKSILPHILNIRPSWVDTYGARMHDGFKIKPKDFAELVYNSLQKTNGYQILDIVVR
jgi:dTDP-4-dehydrorhamnose reductase